MSLLNRELTQEEQGHLLMKLYGFYFKEGVLYTQDGEEFYGVIENCQFDLSTLAGIFAYAINRAKQQGYTDCQWDLKEVLGLI